MSHQSRRTFLKCSGSMLGGLFVGSTVVAAERTDRFIVRTGRRDAPDDLRVVHELPGIAYAVVEGTESSVRSSRSVREYAPDVEVSLADPAVNDAAPTADEVSPSDEPYYGLQWDKQSQNVPAAHETTTGEGTRVAVIDTGVAAGHPDLTVNEGLSRNFTGDGFGSGAPIGGYHGTHVGGIVAANDNGTGVVGTAPDAELVDCRVFSTGLFATFGDVLAAIVYSAAIGADAANLSLGAYPIPREGLGAFYGGALNRTMTYANAQGTFLAIAAGNAAADLQHDRNFISLPNEGAQACSVAATGPIGFRWDAGDGEAPPESPAFYTNYGTNAVTVAAPGGDADLDAIGTGVPWYNDLVLNTVAEPKFRKEDADGDGDEEPVEYLGAEYTYGWAAGTSMAAPQVAGAAALVKSVNPDYTADQVESTLARSASVPDGEDRAFYGAGFIDPAAAVSE